MLYARRSRNGFSMKGSLEAKEAVVLAGGFGTRLRSLVSDVPKPMAPVRNRPFLRYILDQLSDAGLDHVVLAVGYKRDAIMGYFGSQYRRLRLTYSIEDIPLLTGGAVKRALSKCSGDWVFVLNGDSYLDIDFSCMESARDSETDCVIAAHRVDDACRYGTISVDSSGRVEGFKEKGQSSEGLINAGVYLMKRTLLDDLNEAFSLEEDCFQRESDKPEMKIVEFDGTFIDIGVPNDYVRAATVLPESPIDCHIAFFDRDGTINKDPDGHFCDEGAISFIDETLATMRRYSQDQKYRIVVVTNQSGVARGLYSEKDVWSLHSKMQELLESEGIVVDAWYYCPHHPRFTGECDCRKPRTGLIEKALFDFETTPDACVMYGDSESDHMAAQRAGIRFHMVG